MLLKGSDADVKNKWSRHHLISLFFIFFIFIVCAGTAAKGYVSRDEYIKIYSGYLNDNSGAVGKVKASVLTAYETLKNIDGKVYKRTGFINVYGLTQRITGNRYVYDAASSGNDVVKLNNGYLSFVLPKSKDLKKKADKTAAFNARLKNNGIDLLYVQLPFKINKYDKQLPTGVYDYSNENSDIMLSELKSRGVKTYDLREEIIKDGLNRYPLFFRTDHHWKPSTGLWAAGKICEKLNSSFDFNINISKLDKKNFRSTVYRNWFLGSQGKRVGQYYTGVDDFTLLLPTYKTGISSTYYRINGEKIVKNGNFEDAMIFAENLKSKDYFGINTYAAYSGGDFPLTICINKLLADKKILLLRDSYSNVLVPFISLAGCKELRAIDPRHFKGSISDYIEKFNPDIVLMLYYPTALGNSAFFKF